MSTIDASALLRPGLLHGVSIVLAGAPAPAPAPAGAPGADAGDSLGAAVGAACARLGASVSECELGFDGSLALEHTAVEQSVQHALDGLLADAHSVELLVVDGGSLFTHARARTHACSAAGEPGQALGACLDVSWNVTRAVANRAFLPNRGGGRIVYLAPSSDGGEHADAARAGLENLARTLSIEWARHGITAVAIAPGVASAGEVAALTAYLASPAGAYFSGCLLDLRGPARE
jgi:NAD(P)-dependent dehydrogenase (short-subunit alcohol dehydrogenase family)